MRLKLNEEKVERECEIKFWIWFREWRRGFIEERKNKNKNN